MIKAGRLPVVFSRNRAIRSFFDDTCRFSLEEFQQLGKFGICLLA
jgi:hypothetical protein